MNSKKWYQSKAVLGGLVALAVAILSAFGINMEAADTEILVEAALAIGGAVGGILAVVGRVKATTRIGK